MPQTTAGRIQLGLAVIGTLVVLGGIALGTIDGKIKIHDENIGAHAEMQKERNAQYGKILSELQQKNTNDSLLSYQIVRLQGDVAYILNSMGKLEAIERKLASLPIRD